MREKDIEAILPISVIQDDVFFAARAGTLKDQCEQVKCSLRWNIDFPSFNAAWQALVSRHEVLRTSFVWENVAQSVQVLHRTAKVHTATHDLRGAGVAARECNIREIAQVDLSEGIDASRPPLFRVCLMQIGEQSYQLLITYHRLILDRNGARRLLAEFEELYRHTGEQGIGNLAAGGLRDYVSRYRQINGGEKQIGWKEYLHGAMPTQIFGHYQTQHQKASSGRSDAEQRVISPRVVSALHRQVRQYAVDLADIVKTAWAILLSRYTGSDDVLFGEMISEQEGESGALGPYTRVLPTRVRLASTDTFLSAVRTLEQGQRTARHQGVPLAQILHWAGMEEAVTWDHCLSIRKIHSSPESHSGIAPELGNLSFIGSNEVPLVVSAQLTADSLTLEVCCDSGFEQYVAKGILDHLERLLQNVALSFDQTIGSLEMLSEAELKEILIEWNQTVSSHPDTRTLPAIFKAQAEENPDAIALVFGSERLTYAQLNSRANQLANYLLVLGVRQETLIAICLERSVEMIVGLLGILKAGAAYVPLDPSDPTERIASILEHTQSPILLTQSQLAHRLPSHWGHQICLDSQWPGIAQAARSDPKIDVFPESIAYVMYTSGSTGAPKGVAVPHRGVVRLVRESDYINFGPGEVFLQLSPFSFDASTLEIWGALLNGAKLSIMQPQTPELCDIAGSVERDHVTVLWLTAGLFHLMVEQQLPRLKELRYLIAGGEALSARHVNMAVEGLPHTRVVNGYGPTETTTFACCCQLSLLSLTTDRVPIGRPIAHTGVYILDPYLRPVPLGVAGELFISGHGLARGYLQDSGLTAARFIPNPFSEVPGERLYRTGDIARHCFDGNIEFVGRRDRQVKIRGFRVEMQEIELALRQHASVHDAIVISAEDKLGKRLLAYVVTDQPASEAELSQFLRNTLPEYMVPLRIITLTEFPLTPRGKVDRDALLRLFNAPFRQESYIHPESPLEVLLAGIYRDVLGIDRVGVTDNFFSLGGDSMRSIQIISLGEKAGLNFSVGDMFEHQTIRELAHLIENNPGVQAPHECAITAPFALIAEDERQKVPAGVQDAYPLTRLQAGMVFHTELAPKSALYHDILSFHLRMPYRADFLRDVVEQLIARHEVLRTSFDMTSYREPVQLVHSEVPVPLTIEDIRDMTVAEQEACIDLWFQEEKTRSFDWHRAPLMRVHVHRRAEQEVQLTLSFHHAILDGWSVATLLTEICQQYAQMLKGQTLERPQLTSRFRNVLEAERMALTCDKSKMYWLSSLEDLQSVPITRWPVHGRRIRDDEYSLEVPLSTELSTALSRIAAAAQVPLKSILFAAHLRVLTVLTGTDDVVTGFVTHGRPESMSSDQVLGLFLNALPFRIKLSGGTWKDLMAEVFRREQEMSEHRWYPFAQIQQDLGGETPYDTAFTFTHFHVHRALQGMSGIQVLASREFTKANISFAPFFHQDHLSAQIGLTLDYEPAEFPREQIAAIAGYYTRALESIARDPEARYEQQSLVSREEQELLRRWNSTASNVTSADSVHELFEQKVKESPNAIAAIYNNEALTFAELNKKSTRVAGLLRGMGVTEETVVGLCLNHSINLLVGILGILKAGAAFVALDPGYPLQRKSFILDDTQTPVVLTEKALVDGLPVFWGQTVLLDANDTNDVALKNFVSTPDPRQAAYLVYTSGSTGQPKGIVVSHRSLVNNVLAMISFSDIVPQDRLLQFVTFAFDAAVQQIFMTLVSGASLALLDGVTRLSPLELLDRCEDLHVNTLYLPPAYWHEMVRELAETGQNVPDWLRQVLTGGESPSVERLRLWATMNRKGSQFVNAYGPAEATVTATAFKVSAQPCMVESLDRVPIGQAIANMQTFVLDDRLQEVPIGCVGELFLGGTGLARGYHNKPDLTAEKFVPNPFFNADGERLYRTGDMARYLPDGNLEFWGRKDTQIKVNGHRVEPSEVEMAIGQHSKVHASVVLKSARAGAGPLIAYVTARNGDSLYPAELTAHIRSILPEYMVPRTIFVVPEIPLNAAGKVDVHRLEEMAQNSESPLKTRPRNGTEEVLAGIWQELLGINTIGIHDNFFDIGGHSLLATQVVSRVRENLEVDLPLRTLFDMPTIAQLAEVLDGREKQPPTIIPRIPRDGQIPLSFAQQRLWFLDQLRPGNPLYNVPSLVSLKGPLDRDSVERSLTEIVCRHEVLRTVFTDSEHHPVQTVLPATPFHIPVIDLTRTEQNARQDEVRRMCREEAQRPFDLGHGPLLRVSLLRLGEEDHVLVFTIHHIAADGWSIGILLEEFTELYSSFTSGHQPSLPSLIFQYADFAVWQRLWLSGEVLEEQLAYWKTKLQGAPKILELPLDHPRPPIRSARGASESLTLAAEPIRRLARRCGATEFMVLLAAFNIFLHRYTGMEDIVVGSDIGNRTVPGTENLIGFFVNQLVLRNDLSGDPTFMELLQRVRRTSLDAYSHQALPFEKLVEVLRPDRSSSHTPLFQVKFTLDDVPAYKLKLPKVAVSFPDAETGIARYDLTLSLHHQENELTGVLEYDADLFEAATAKRMAAQLKTLVESAVAAPDHPIAQLSMLSGAEKRYLLDLNREDLTDYHGDKSLHALFEEQAARSPEAVALVLEKRPMTYGELNERSNQVAWYLKRSGVRAYDLVGICLNRSFEMVIAILAVLKTGAAYLPLDPAYPQGRLAFMVEDAQPTLVITQEDYRAMFAELPISRLFLDSEYDRISVESRGNLGVPASPDAPAYVIYTSGSTGVPKGCLVTHGNVARLFHATEAWYHFLETDVWSLFHSYAFDFSVWELWGALIYGGRLVIVPAHVVRSPSDFCRLIREEGITVLNQTPSSFRQLIRSENDCGNLEVFPLRLIILGGEALDMSDLKPWFQHHRDGRPVLVNMYGITETTVHVSYRPLSYKDIDAGSVIGRPIPDMQVYLADSRLELVPVGTPGEIYVGGAGVSQGYLGRPDLTAERFVPDPFSGIAGARLYKTGDLGRYQGDGDLLYIGRSDNQVKIRGYRIELEEIEATLRRHPGVQDAAALLSGADLSDRRIVAYVVGNGLGFPSSHQLRRFLAEKMPNYMVPASFVNLERLPLLPNGKVDRKTLACLPVHEEVSKTSHTSPENELERVVAEAWKEALKIEEVGIDENFFDLGGHSLLMLEVRSWLQSKLEVEVSVTDMFEYPTIRAFTQHLAGPQHNTNVTTIGQERARKQKQAQKRIKQPRVEDLRL